MLVQEPVGWILKLSISQSLMKHRKLKSPFQPLKVTGSFKKWAIVSWFPFGLFVVNLLLYNINIEKKNRIETMILSLPGSWSQLSHWWSCNILFGIFHKSFLYLFLYFFDLLRYPHSFYSLGVTSILFSQQYHPWIKL